MGDILEIKTRVCLLADEQRIATHLLKQVDDLQKTQNILGHKNIKTTAIHPPLEGLSASGGFIRLGRIYTHVSNVAKNKIVSPLDNLKLGKKNER
jgi:hypothetical protein